MTKKTNKNKKGQKGKFHEWLTEEGLIKIEGWAKSGLSDKQIANNVGVSERTFTRWKADHPTILSVLKRGKEVVDFEVENALYKNATGFEYEEVKTYIEEIDGKQRKKIEKTKKLMRPDTTAQIFWLKNRKPAEWREKQWLEHSGQVDISEQAKRIEDFINEQNYDEE